MIVMIPDSGSSDFRPPAPHENFPLLSASCTAEHTFFHLFHLRGSVSGFLNLLFPLFFCFFDCVVIIAYACTCPQLVFYTILPFYFREILQFSHFLLIICLLCGLFPVFILSICLNFSKIRTFFCGVRRFVAYTCEIFWYSHGKYGRME